MNPFISIVIPTKNSLPQIKGAIKALQKQTFRNFELIIQDGGSTDGTLEYLEKIHDLRIEIASEKDSGIGQAYNRGIKRSKGDLLCLLGSDERLFPHSLQLGVDWFRECPHAAAHYGAVSLINRWGFRRSLFVPKPFDLVKVMQCEVVPSFAACVLNRKLIGDDLYYDETLKTCPDYDFWLRLGSRFSSEELRSRNEVFARAIADRTSMTFREESYEQFCKDKCFALKRYIASNQNLPNPKLLEQEGQKGIFTWALRSVLHFAGVSPYAKKLFSMQKELYDSPSFNGKVVRSSLPYEFCNQSGRKFFYSLLKSCIRGGNGWKWLAKAPVPTSFPSDLWVKVEIKVKKGSVGVCLMEGNNIEKERLLPPDENFETVWFPLSGRTHPWILLRMGGIFKCSMQIKDISLCKI